MTLQDLFGPVSTRPYVIDDFDNFVLSNVPYGEVSARNVQWGAVAFDGPLAPGVQGTKPAMQWFLGGVAYPITLAIQVRYSYTRTWDGSNAPVTDTILFGLQECLDDYIKPQPVPFVASPTNPIIGTYGDPTNPLWGSEPARLASQAAGVVTAALAPPSRTPALVSGGQAMAPTFYSLIQSQLVGHPRAQTFEDLITKPGRVLIDFDGPAKNSDSLNIFPYTAAQLFNQLDLYQLTQFWYFSGKPRRVVKAMRIPLAVDQVQAATASSPPQPTDQSFAMFIGYSGASPGG
jgi:hypothetical protein